MKILGITSVLAALALGGVSAASADPWDRGGHGRNGGYERGDGYPGRGNGYGRQGRFEQQVFPGQAYGYNGRERPRRGEVIHESHRYLGRGQVEVQRSGPPGYDRCWVNRAGQKECR